MQGPVPWYFGDISGVVTMLPEGEGPASLGIP